MSADSESTSRSLSVRRGQSLELRRSDAIVTRGLQEIAQFGDRARAKELVELGEACYKNEECDEAIAYFTEAIAADPQYAEAYRARGDAYRLQRYGEELLVYGELRHNFEELANEGECDEDGEYDIDEAIAEYVEAVGGYFDRLADNYDNAIADYSCAIRLDPDHARDYYDRAKAYQDKRDYYQAIDDFTEAIRLDPNYAEAYHWRGYAHRKNGEHAKAKLDFAEAERLRCPPSSGTTSDPPKKHPGADFCCATKAERDSSLADMEPLILLPPAEPGEVCWEETGIRCTG